MLPAAPGQPVEAWAREADQITLPRLADVGAHTRPNQLGTTYAEHEYAALADEQEAAWAASGENSARQHAASAAGLETPAVATAFILAEAGKEVVAAQADRQHATQVLAPYVRRGPGEKLRYWIAWIVLVLGDTGGVWSAAVVNGDVPMIAFFQALASGVAAACSGLVGAELKDMRMARVRRRDLDSLTDDERRYQRFFTSRNDGVGIVKLIGALSLLVVALVAVGIFALRAAIEGNISGLTFGLLAAATALASGLLTYSASDDVADLLASMGKRVALAEKRYLALANHKAIVGRAAHAATAGSVQTEAKLRGEAAAKRVESLGWRVQRNNPGVLGHGFAPGESRGAIGWRTRRGDI
ncbi:hypothetical protein GCM10011609_71570 [Lentzea pudingi]|uniref:SMODS and SLOG-associating 2TM effector domain-containing protein n=1 Tax=Lentzea pudingi TaxID=1789439 RepID=A0ABQ2IM87_9PSEU|nr:hypothetical protein GCM10011609_71570 [Lentzea pudingi]